MKHIKKVFKKPGKKGDYYEAVCGAEIPLGMVTWFDGKKSGHGPINTLVEAALESDCNECRRKVGVGRVNDRVWDNEKKVLGVHEHREWDPRPMENADQILEYVMNRRA